MTKRIGIIAIADISKPGGFPRVTIDLINNLDRLGYEIYLLTPYKLDYKKISELHSPIKLKKVFYSGKIKSKLCKERTLSRKLMISEFKKMAKQVNFIVDLDGGIFHKYLPKNFDNKKYIIWRISCCLEDFKKFPWIKKTFKKKIKLLIRNSLGFKEKLPKEKFKVYAIDEWTAKELREYLGVHSEQLKLYPEIKIKDFKYKKEKKKNQIIVLGRIAQNKMIEDAIKIFAKGTEKFSEYKLIILGGLIEDSHIYLKKLRSLIKKLNIKNRVEIIPNPDFKTLKKIVLESKVILDAQRKVSLTMTSIEAMAAGNIVLAYKNSGTYLEILKKGKYGYGFKDWKEGGKELEKILEKIRKEKKKQKLKNYRKTIKRAEDFSHKSFMKNIQKIIKISEKN